RPPDPPGDPGNALPEGTDLPDRAGLRRRHPSPGSHDRTAGAAPAGPYSSQAVSRAPATAPSTAQDTPKATFTDEASDCGRMMIIGSRGSIVAGGPAATVYFTGKPSDLVVRVTLETLLPSRTYGNTSGPA